MSALRITQCTVLETARCWMRAPPRVSGGGRASIHEWATARGSRIMCSRYGSMPGIRVSAAAPDGTFDESTMRSAQVTSAMAW